MRNNHAARISKLFQVLPSGPDYAGYLSLQRNDLVRVQTILITAVPFAARCASFATMHAADITTAPRGGEAALSRSF